MAPDFYESPVHAINSSRRIENEASKEEEETTRDWEPLNIVLLYADDWRYDAIGASPNTIVKTPFLDWLAKQGVRFTHNCVTTSVCWISRATLYTGQYVSRHKTTYPQTPNWYEGWTNTFPHLLRRNHYHVGHVGKWHFFNYSVGADFDFWRAYYGFHWAENKKKKSRIHVTKKNEEDALTFLQERPKNKPFMLGVCFFAPHSVDGTDGQFFPQVESMPLYANEEVEVPLSADSWDKLPHFFSETNEARRRWRIRFETPEKYQHMMKNYYRLITEIDKTSEVIFQELEKQGVLNQTLVIFTTDNGFFHSEHGLAGKWYPHQESIRVPLIVKDPRMPPETIGTLNDAFTLNIDLASTILGAAKIPQPSVMQGRDIADLYLGRGKEWRKEFFYEHPVHLHTSIIPASTALVRKDYKFLTWPNYHVEQLFHLQNDPLELNDLIGSPEHKDLIDEMRARHDELKSLAA